MEYLEPEVELRWVEGSKGGMTEVTEFEEGRAEEYSDGSLTEGPSSAVHLLQCPLVGDGSGRTLEQAEQDSEWCWEAARFLRQ